MTPTTLFFVKHTQRRTAYYPLTATSTHTQVGQTKAADGNNESEYLKSSERNKQKD